MPKMPSQKHVLGSHPVIYWTQILWQFSFRCEQYPIKSDRFCMTNMNIHFSASTPSLILIDWPSSQIVYCPSAVHISNEAISNLSNQNSLFYLFVNFLFERNNERTEMKMSNVVTNTTNNNRPIERRKIPLFNVSGIKDTLTHKPNGKQQWIVYKIRGDKRLRQYIDFLVIKRNERMRSVEGAEKNRKITGRTVTEIRAHVCRAEEFVSFEIAEDKWLFYYSHSIRIPFTD